MSHLFKKTPKEYLYMHVYYSYIKTQLELKLADAKESGNQINLNMNQE